MRRSTFHIASALLLIGSLLFTQLAVNFFHRNHNVHEVKAKGSEKNAAAEFHQHGEHCTVCTIDFFNHAFVHSEFQGLGSFHTADVIASQVSSFLGITNSFLRGRAPPVLFI